MISDGSLICDILLNIINFLFVITYSAIVVQYCCFCVNPTQILLLPLSSTMRPEVARARARVY